MIALLRTDGLTGPSGAQYIIIQQDDRTACIPLARFIFDEKGAKAGLMGQGIAVVGNTAWRKLIEKVEGVRDYPAAPVVEKVGWNGAHFVLPDGTIFPNEAQGIPTAIDIYRRKCGQAGTFSEWYNRVAKRLEGQHLATFVMMAAFAAPLLDLTDRVGNFGFEVVGPKGTGKSTLQYLASSALGGVGQGPGGHYWITLDTTYNALEDTMKLHSDLLIIMDEANLLAADAPPKERAALFKALAFKLGSGSLKGRFGSVDETDYRLVFVISSNEPLASLLGQSTESARAAADRLITLPLDDARPYGVFDHLPDDVESASEFAQGLMRAAEQSHGHGLRRFLKHLVKARSGDEVALRQKIRTALLEFREQAGVDANDGSAVRVADAFGLVFAAGKLAQEYGVLPKRLKPRVASLRTYRMHLAHAPNSYAPFEDRLNKLRSDDRVVRIKKKSKKIDSRPKAALAFIKKTESHWELLVPPANIIELFPDWEHIKGSAEVRRCMNKEGQRLTLKRRICGGSPERVYCFKIPFSKPTGSG